MKDLFPAQQRVADKFLSRLLSGGNSLDTSDLGTGKTVVACWVARQFNAFRPGSRVAVICPKAAIGAWTRELDDAEIEPLFVLNYEKLRNGKTPWMTKTGKKIMRWALPPGTLVLFDEIHSAKGEYTQNAQLAISLVQQGFRVHGMSATAAENPTEMRALGFMLELHSLNASKLPLQSWFQWMRAHGCQQNPWNAWEFTDVKRLPYLHSLLYEGYNAPAARISVSDMPEAFKENRVIIDPVEFDGIAKVRAAYDDLGITPEIIENYILHGTVENSDWVLVNILRARQLAESLKVPLITAIADDLVSQGYSVVVFVNFTETLEALRAHFKRGVIAGGQTGEERQRVIDDFQADRSRVIVVNAKAGGSAISLHDQRGKHPRVSLISPDFSAKVFSQCLGRIYRNGAKSNAVQKVLVAKDTVEEHVVKAIIKKLRNLNALHGIEDALWKDHA
jgi:superfamily II DNA or RNA helicase